MKKTGRKYAWGGWWRGDGEEENEYQEIDKGRYGEWNVKG